MAENMLLGGIDPIVTAIYGARAGNKIIPKNDVAKSLVEAKPCLLYTSPSPRDRG